MLLLTLDTFSRTGGIQHFNRCLQLALCKYADQKDLPLVHYALMDTTGQQDLLYFEGQNVTFRGFGNHKPSFILAALAAAREADTILFGHVNLAPLCLLPGFGGKRCIMAAHGIEVWKKLPRLKKRGLLKMDTILAVSRFTAEKLQQVHGVKPSRITLFPNTLDPFFETAPLLPSTEWNRDWRINSNGQYLLTVARLSHTEADKGYDTVIRLLPDLAKTFPGIAYILAGKADGAEYSRIRNLAESLGVGDRLLMPGFVPANRLPSLYRLASVFVLPSTKEGFGIVLLEAAWHGCAIVACQSGGAPEALLQGKLGTLVPPENRETLFEALFQTLLNPIANPLRQSENRALITAHFGFSRFCSRLSEVLSVH